MARGGGRPGNLRYALLALVIAVMLWSFAHGGSEEERPYDVPVVLTSLPEDLVITEQSAAEINVRVLGTRASVRNLSPRDLEYAINMAGAKPGRTVHEVETTRIDMPRGVRIVSRSPSQISVRFEERGRKNVRVRPDVAGEPAEGFKLGSVEVDPPRVWLTGARSRVLRMSEVVTETIDVTGLESPAERQVKLSLGGDRVWMEVDAPVTVRIAVEPVDPPEGGGAEAEETG